MIQAVNKIVFAIQAVNEDVFRQSQELYHTKSEFCKLNSCFHLFLHLLYKYIISPCEHMLKLLQRFCLLTTCLRTASTITDNFARHQWCSIFPLFPINSLFVDCLLLLHYVPGIPSSNLNNLTYVELVRNLVAHGDAREGK